LLIAVPLLLFSVERAASQLPPEGPPIRHGNIRGRGYYH
jgi:hypothetical protein